MAGRVVRSPEERSVVGHTPGPYTTNVARLSDGSINVAHVLGPQGQGLAQVGVYGEVETLANLNLFAAAPEMAAELSQLEIELESFIECDTSPTQEWLRDNLASIAKVLTNAIGTPY
jgi:hypothetical protein